MIEFVEKPTQRHNHSAILPSVLIYEIIILYTSNSSSIIFKTT